MNDEAKKYIEAIATSIKLDVALGGDLFESRLTANLTQLYEYGKVDGCISEIQKSLKHGKVNS